MQPDFIAPMVERILKKYTCASCGERTARVEPAVADDQAINCWKCSTEIGRTAGEFRRDTHKLGKAQIDYVLMSPAMKVLDDDK